MSNKPLCLPVQFDQIPIELKQTPRWVLWRLVEVGEEGNKRWSKLPTQNNGQPASSTNPSTWTDFVTVQHAYQTSNNKYDGVGFVFTDDDDVIGVDLDDCYDADMGVFTNAALQHIADQIDGYMEVSPSGTGVKIFTRANLPASHVDHAIGLEIYPKSRYFTVTGHYIKGHIPTEPQNLTEIVPPRTISQTGDKFADYVAPLEEYDLKRVEDELLAKYSDYGYDNWLKIGMILHHQFEGSEDALEAWDRWSSNGPKYQSNACEDKWRGFKGAGATLRSLIIRLKSRNCGLMRLRHINGLMTSPALVMRHTRALRRII